MKTISLSKYGPVVSTEEAGAEIYELIVQELKTSEEVTIELDDIKSMATFCAKQVFGRLYLNMGSEAFFSKITLSGADNDLKTIIKIGIQHALDEGQ